MENNYDKKPYGLRNSGYENRERQYVGKGYAMENAVPGVLKEMRLVAPRNTDHGVARIANMDLDEGRMGGSAQ